MRLKFKSQQSLSYLTGRGVTASLTSNSTGIGLTGNNISLDISYTAKDATILWYRNNTLLARWINGQPSVSPSYTNVQIFGKGSLFILNSTKNDNGNYTVVVNSFSDPTESLNFQVRVYDRVVNVTVTQSPPLVDESTASVSLTCRATGDVESISWTKEGQTLGYNDSYILLDGNRTLQVKYPNRTYTGNYTCNSSNPLSWDKGSWELNVTYNDNLNSAALSGGAIAGIVIGSVLGAILIITLIVILIFCMRKRKTGKGKKAGGPSHKDVLRTVSGNTLSPDDPAYFTVNNIMYRNSSISMGSYIMNTGDNMSEYTIPTPHPSSSPPRIKHATQPMQQLAGVAATPTPIGDMLFGSVQLLSVSKELSTWTLNFLNFK
ncbi:uncharacterized protein PAF06_016084 [Gastrophryne carolinensis]